MEKQTIQIGVSGWGDHDIYLKGTPSNEKLTFYSNQFPVVELDSMYHAIVPASRMEKWVNQTPDSFQFVVKAYRELTGHGRKERAPIRTWGQIVQEMKESLVPLQEAGKLSCVLFQFPPWYDCQKKHVQYIRKIKEAFADVPVAIEFRNESWFTPAIKEKTIQFLQKASLIHVICDEPQVGGTSIPIVPITTHNEKVLIRFHGRNVNGWNYTGQPNWRQVRYAYRYSKEELREWVNIVQSLQKETKEIVIIFNNNSEGDAANNAIEFMQLLGLKTPPPIPKQLDLFSLGE